MRWSEQNMTLRSFPAAGSTCRTGSASAWAAILEMLKEGLVRLGSALDELQMKKADVFEFFRRLAESNPAPETELEYVNPYTLLVAVALSAQATDVGVNKATRALFAKVTTPQQMLDLGEEGLKQHIKTIGLYNTKAKNVIAAARILVDEFGGEVPQERDKLRSCSGVGRKTANVVLNVAFGRPTIAVDTHIFRVSNRTGLAPGKNPLQVELKLESWCPNPSFTHAHHWLILHGRYICKARTPECWHCPSWTCAPTSRRRRRRRLDPAPLQPVAESRQQAHIATGHVASAAEGKS